jgi:hypothetical protein
MPIRSVLKDDHAFSPEDVTAITNAFENCLSKLGLRDRTDPATMAVAKVVIELAKQGERDPERLCAGAIKHIAAAR